MDTLASKLYQRHHEVYYGNKAVIPDYTSLPESIQEVWEAVAETAKQEVAIAKAPRPRKTTPPKNTTEE